MTAMLIARTTVGIELKLQKIRETRRRWRRRRTALNPSSTQTVFATRTTVTPYRPLPWNCANRKTPAPPPVPAIPPSTTTSSNPSGTRTRSVVSAVRHPHGPAHVLATGSTVCRTFQRKLHSGTADSHDVTTGLPARWRWHHHRHRRHRCRRPRRPSPQATYSQRCRICLADHLPLT